MNSYFDQQWDQQLAGRPQALAAFSVFPAMAAPPYSSHAVKLPSALTVTGW